MGIQLIEQARRDGIPAYPVEFTTTNLRAMAQSTLDAFQEHQLTIYADPVLLADLRALRVKESGNSFRLFAVRGESAGTAHADVATSLSLALLAAKRSEQVAPQIAYNGAPLLCFP